MSEFNPEQTDEFGPEAGDTPVTEQPPVDDQDQSERGEGQTQDEAAGETEDDSFGGGEAGQADVSYSPGAETINPAFVTRNQDEDAADDEDSDKE